MGPEVRTKYAVIIGPAESYVITGLLYCTAMLLLLLAFFFMQDSKRCESSLTILRTFIDFFVEKEKTDHDVVP